MIARQDPGSFCMNRLAGSCRLAPFFLVLEGLLGALIADLVELDGTAIGHLESKLAGVSGNAALRLLSAGGRFRTVSARFLFSGLGWIGTGGLLRPGGG